MTPRNTLAEHYGIMQADEILSIIKAANYIIVPKGAIGQAQREAVAAYREDAANDNKPRHYDRDGYCDNPARGY